jgi:hypothetical protein
MSTDKPVNLQHFYPEARTFTLELNRKKPCVSDVILDDWGGGPRLIYGGNCVERCPVTCDECPLYRLVGVDEVVPSSKRLQTTLCTPREQQLSLIPNQQRCLNCKTPKQYMYFFIQWALHRCDSEELLLDELDWIRGFRVILVAGDSDEQHLASSEREMKIDILRKVFARHPSEKMRGLVYQFAHDNNLVRRPRR